MKSRIFWLVSFVSLLILFSCKKSEEAKALAVEKAKIPWMSNLMKKYPDKDIKFSNICIPGSHDAGMYLIRNCSIGANECNTQTQALPIKEQLEIGYRYFDLRPTKLRGELLTYHFNECGGMGCYGGDLKTIFREVNNFIKKYREVVILQFDHFCKLTPDDDRFYKLLQDTFKDNIYRETARNEHIYDWDLRDILGENGQGKVILLFKNTGIPNSDEYRQKGYFDFEILNNIGGWTDKNSYKKLKESQLENYNNYVPQYPNLFEFSWQMTHETADVIRCLIDKSNSIKAMSKKSNAGFQEVVDSMIQTGAIHSSKMPNFFWLDYGGDWMRDVATRISEIGINQ